MKHLKELIKKPFYSLSLVFFIIIIIIFLLFFYGLKKTSDKLDFYEQEVPKISNSMSEINETIDQGFVKLNSAELLLTNTNKIISTVYFGTADKGECVELKNFTGFSMQYNDEFYLITAGHCVEMDGENMKTSNLSPIIVKIGYYQNCLITEVIIKIIWTMQFFILVAPSIQD